MERWAKGRVVREPGRGEPADPLKLRREHPVLSREQERILLVAYKTHNNRRQFLQEHPGFLDSFVDERRREQMHRIIGVSASVEDMMLACNFQLIEKIARRYTPAGVDIEPAIAASQMGFRQALERFDMTRETRISTYAVWYMRAAVHDYIREEAFAHPIPRVVMRAMPRVSRINAAFLALYHREPTRDELLAQLMVNAPELPVRRIRTILEYMDLLEGKEKAPQGALDIQSWGHRESRTSSNMSQDTVNATKGEAQKDFMRRRMTEILNTLPPHVQYAVRARFGFETGGEHTLPEIAEKLETTEAEVAKMLQGAMEVFQQESGKQTDADTATGEPEVSTETVPVDFVSITHEQVEEALRRHGIRTATNATAVSAQPRRRGSPVDVSQYVVVANLLQQGMSFSEIARQLGIGHRAISEKAHRLYDIGIATPVDKAKKPGKQEEEKKRAIIDRDSYRSEATAAVGEYIRAHPALSPKAQLSGVVRMRRPLT